MKFWHKRGPRVSKKANLVIKDLHKDDIKSIAVIRHAALGDMVITRCFLIELRKAFKNARITLSVHEDYKRGLPHDLVDRVHEVYSSGRKNLSYGDKIKRFKELGHHDLVFDLAATPRSFATCYFNSAKLKFGFPYRAIQAKLFFDVTVPRSDLCYEVDDMLSMLHIMGIKTEFPYVFNMPGETLTRERPYIVYFTGSAGLDRCWPVNEYARLVASMSESYPHYDHLILEGLHDWEKAEPVLKENKTRNNVSPVTADNLDETIALVKGATLVVANDTGIRHLAIVCDTPTVGIFFASYPFRYWPRTHHHDVVIPEGEGHPTVDEVLSCCRKTLAAIELEK